MKSLICSCILISQIFAMNFCGLEFRLLETVSPEIKLIEKKDHNMEFLYFEKKQDGFTCGFYLDKVDKKIVRATISFHDQITSKLPPEFGQSIFSQGIISYKEQDQKPKELKTNSYSKFIDVYSEHTFEILKQDVIYNAINMPHGEYAWIKSECKSPGTDCQNEIEIISAEFMNKQKTNHKIYKKIKTKKIGEF